MKIKDIYKEDIKYYKQYLLDVLDDEETSENIKTLIQNFFKLELYEQNLLALRIIYDKYSYDDLSQETGLDKNTYIKQIKIIKRKLHS